VKRKREKRSWNAFQLCCWSWAINKTKKKCLVEGRVKRGAPKNVENGISAEHGVKKGQHGLIKRKRQKEGLYVGGKGKRYHIEDNEKGKKNYSTKMLWKEKGEIKNTSAEAPGVKLRWNEIIQESLRNYRFLNPEEDSRAEVKRDK